MPLTTSGLSVDSANPIYKKRWEDISFAFSFAASDSVSWTGLTIKGQLRNSSDQLIWDSGNVSATVAGSGAASATIVNGPAIETALNSLPDPPRTIARNRWENKDTISSGSSIISAMQALLGWSSAYVDELFRAADAL